MPGVMTLRFGQTHSAATTTTRAYLVPGFPTPTYVVTSFTTAKQYMTPGTTQTGER